MLILTEETTTQLQGRRRRKPRPPALIYPEWTRMRPQDAQLLVRVYRRAVHALKFWVFILSLFAVLNIILLYDIARIIHHR